MSARIAVLRLLVPLALALLVPAAAAAPERSETVRLKFHYRTHDGRIRSALVLVPSWYPRSGGAPLPLVIVPHGRGVAPATTLRLWGALPAHLGFAVVAPDGQGRRLERFSWGYRGQIDDLARMPALVGHAFPWVRIDPKRIYAFGSSMGGQEALLLAAQHPHLLAGVAAFDAVTDFALQYRNFPRLPCKAKCTRTWNGRIGPGLQALAREEVGGPPHRVPNAYARRSPLTFAAALAFSHVPLELWWSRHDRIVVDQPAQSGRLYRRIEQLNPHAPVTAFVGVWHHSAEFRAGTQLPRALRAIGLAPVPADHRPPPHGQPADPDASRTLAGVAAACPQPRFAAGEATQALAAGTDVLGARLVRSAQGPTYAAIARLLPPLLIAGHRPGELSRPLTESGVYYLAFGEPGGKVALHVADGSQIVSQRYDGPRTTVYVGGERFGSCLARLAEPRLYDGYLPILETRYGRYRQESFVAGSTSYVHVDGGAARFVPSHGAPVAAAYVARSISTGALRAVDAATYDAARRSMIDFWNARLAQGAFFDVPERRVVDAERNLLIQNLQLAWRYSLGNPYQELELPEALDAADVLAEYGFRDDAAAIVRTSLAHPNGLYPNWSSGATLQSAARLALLGGDALAPSYRRFLDAFARQLDASPRRLLDRERYASDLPDRAYGLNNQAVVLAALRTAAAAWTRAGDSADAARAQRLAATLAAGLHAAVRRSERHLPDGSLFVPVKLFDTAPPFGQVTASRAGTYWNLVLPYALASGLFAPHGREANGILRYLTLHGSRFLGLVRAGAYSLYGRDAGAATGTDEVYGLNVARFLADNDKPDQLVLSLYGQLAAAMTRNTFVSGEGATLTPLGGSAYRSMYLPPNATSNAAFLEKLRLTVVHETANGLQLAYATPRAWLAPGKRIAVRNAPTRFGPLSFTLAAARGAVHVTLDVPHVRSLQLRLRLPHVTRTLDLGGRSGRIELSVKTARGGR